MRLSVYVGSTVIVAFYGASTVAMLVFGIPRPGETWFTHVISKTFARSNILAMPLTCVGLVIDVVLLLLPIVAISSLQLSKKKKIGAIVVFATGLL